MDELHGDARVHRGLRARRGGEVDEKGPQALASRRECLSADLRGDPAVPADRLLEPFLELGQIGVEAGRVAELCQRAQRASPV
jgi:hypothetical protein